MHEAIRQYNHRTPRRQPDAYLELLINIIKTKAMFKYQFFKLSNELLKNGNKEVYDYLIKIGIVEVTVNACEQARCLI